MRTIVIAAAISLLAACRGPDTSAADRTAIQALIAETAAMNNAGDATGWAGLFAEDAVYMPGG